MTFFNNKREVIQKKDFEEKKGIICKGFKPKLS